MVDEVALDVPVLAVGRVVEARERDQPPTQVAVQPPAADAHDLVDGGHEPVREGIGERRLAEHFLQPDPRLGPQCRIVEVGPDAPAQLTPDGGGHVGAERTMNDGEAAFDELVDLLGAERIRHRIDRTSRRRDHHVAGEGDNSLDMDTHLYISKECVIQKVTMVLVLLFVVAGTGELGPHVGLRRA
jgi:hypothetical protein